MEETNIPYSIYLYFGFLAVTCLALTVSICLFRWKELNLPLQRLFHFLILNLVTEIVARIFAYSGINNLPLLHLYTIGEFVLLSYFYKSLIGIPHLFQRIFRPFVWSGVLLIILNSLFLQDLYTFNTIAKTFVQITVITYAVLYFYNLMENQSFTPRIAKSLRLINSAILIYYSGSLFIFMCSQVSFINSDLYEVFWAFNAVLNFIFQLLILWGIWIVAFPKTHSPS